MKKHFLYYSLIAVSALFTAQTLSAQTPGGAEGSIVAWLTPENYDGAVWTNLAAGTQSVGNFSQSGLLGTLTNAKPPLLIDRGYNFHQSLFFEKTSNSAAPNRLQSASAYVHYPADNVTTIFVFKRKMNSYDRDGILSLSNSGSSSTYEGDIYWNSKSSGQMYYYWNGNTNRLDAAHSATEGMVTIDNANNTSTATGGINFYLNGGKLGSTMSSGTNKLYDNGSRMVIGGIYNRYATDYGFEGDLQEVIVLKAAGGANSHLSKTDFQKIHTYLGLKYGISVKLNSNADNYINSLGDTVWHYDAKYNSNIIGLGRDDAGNLYQKQAVSTTSDALKLFIGSKIQTLNSQNTATLPNRKYLVVAYDGSTGWYSHHIKAGTQYQNGQIPSDLNFHSGIYKAEVSGDTAFTIKFQVMTMLKYVVVSTTDTFNLDSTMFYPINKGIGEITLNKKYRYFYFSGYSKGPGNVGNGLMLWLRADDPNTVKTENVTKTDATVSGYPAAEANAVPGTTLPAVVSWNDYIHAQDYNFANDINSGVGNPRKPVFKETTPIMNFHPALRFYKTSSSGSSLRNNKGIMISITQGTQHTVIVVLNSAFNGSNAWLYPMSFNAQYGALLGPMYGFQKSGTNMIGRLRMTGSSDQQITGNANLYRAGSTSILQYDFDFLGRTVTFNFNGKTETVSHSQTSLRPDFMTSYSILGYGYNYDRAIDGTMSEVIVYSGIISDNDREQIDGYLALKYGTTLHTFKGNGRYDYYIKNRTVPVWLGETNATGKFANYYNNVAAVVRDDGTALNNRQSHSTGSGSILHMGVAGSTLGGNTDELGELQDNEAVAFGHNGKGGITSIQDICGNYNTVFNRNWLVHKVTTGNRAVSMLVGLEDNSGNLLGNSDSDASAADKAYYGLLKSGNVFAMLVSNDSTKINPNHANFLLGDYKVIPMQYINSEWQCNFIFSKEDTYITFAYKGSTAGCTATSQFSGVKTFSWEQWKYPTHYKSGAASAGMSFSQTAFDLGDGITATTSVKYASKVRTPYGYPRFVTSPRGALEVRRKYGAVGDKVTVTIEFNDAVIPEFSILDLDGYGRNYDEVTISGSCGTAGSNIAPTLKAAGIKPVFTINGNKATVNQHKSLKTTDKNGTLNVSFETGIKIITIEYTLQNRADSYVQSILISPINIRQGALPPPIINMDGIAFQQQVKNKVISACDVIEYTFLIQNANMHDKYFNLRDTIPVGLTWKAESVGIDTNNPKMHSIINYAGNRILALDSILVPCVSTIKITAIAEPDEYSSGEFQNSAVLIYENDEKRDTAIVSMDAETHDLHTDVDVIYAKRYFPLKITHIEPKKYHDNDTVDVLLKIYNPNSQDVANLFMNVNWGSNFAYVPNSLIINNDSIEGATAVSGWTNVQPKPAYLPTDTVQTLLIAGATDASAGFLLPQMDTTLIRFKIKAPALAYLKYETDENGQPTDHINPLIVSLDLFMDSPDICALYALTNTETEITVPFRDPMYIDSIRYNVGPNTGGAYTGTSNSGNGSPVHLGIDAGESVTIYGGGFLIGGNDIEVSFGGVSAAIARHNADDTLRVVPPPVSSKMVFSSDYSAAHGGEGKVDVSIRIGNGLGGTLFTATLKSGYTYRAPIVINSIMPDNGPVSGGTEVTIKGYNFLPPSIFPATPMCIIFESADGVRDTVLVSASHNDNIVIRTLPHLVSHARLWVDNLREKSDTVFTFYPNVFIEDGKWTEYWKWENHTSENILPYPLADIHIKANILQDIDVNMDSITVYPALKYTVDTAKIVKANIFTLSDNASFLNYGKDSIAEARALHILKQGRNWYISSPMQGDPLRVQSPDPMLAFDTMGNNLNTAINQAISTSWDKKWRVEWYNENKAAPSDIHGYSKWELMLPNDELLTGRGYVAYSDSADIAVQFRGKFTDGKTVAPLSQMLTNTPDGHPKQAFNLVGNPYPSYWRWTAAAAAAAGAYSTIWYRTNIGTPPNRNAYQFWAYNAAGDVAVAPGWEDAVSSKPYSLAYIPPMQGFWIKLQEVSSNTYLTFDNARRSHANNVSNILKVPSNPSFSSGVNTEQSDVPFTEGDGREARRSLLRLSVETLHVPSLQTDETLIYAHDNAQSDFDDYDSEKLFGGFGAEIYTVTNCNNSQFSIFNSQFKKELVINGIPRFHTGLEIPLGFTADLGGSFTLRASEIANIDTLDVILLDRWRGEEFDLRRSISEAEGYNFTAGSGSNTERFAIAFRQKSQTGTENSIGSHNALLAYSNVACQITVLYSDSNQHGKTVPVSVFDVSGRKLTEQSVSVGVPATLAAAFANGVYIVKAGTKSARVVVE